MWPEGLVFPDGKSMLTTGEIGTVWNLATGEPWRWGLLMGQTGPVMEIDIAASGRRFATRAGRFGGNDWEVRVWELPADPDAAGASCREVFRHQGEIDHLELSDDGQLLLLKVRDLEVWEVDSGRQRGSVPGASGRFSPDSKQFAISDDVPGIIIYDSATLQAVRHLSVIAEGPSHLHFTPDGKHLCFYATGWVRCLDVKTGQEQIPFSVSAETP